VGVWLSAACVRAMSVYTTGLCSVSDSPGAICSAVRPLSHFGDRSGACCPESHCPTSSFGQHNLPALILGP
jgi:hypothetical protein